MRGLHEILAADKDRRIRRKLARINRRHKATIRRSNWLLKFVKRLGIKPAPKPRPAAQPPIDIAAPLAAADHW